jgi:FAD:protein FMN transferase
MFSTPAFRMPALAFRMLASNAEPLVRLATRAMNTRFELVLWGRDKAYLTAVGEEALREIEALNQQLSFYRDDSDIRELNVAAAHRPIAVEPRLFRLLKRAKTLHSVTSGAFDITIGPLLQAWGFTGDGGRVPTDEELAAARERCGIDLVELDPEPQTVRYLREGVLIDLGAFGKGYAIERACNILREAELGGALLHGGTSTVQALGTQPDGQPWRIALQHPTDPEQHLATVELQDQALSVSAGHGKTFTHDGREYGHVLDPRTGEPVQGALLAAVRTSSAADSDALSTALLVLGSKGLALIAAYDQRAAALVAVDGEDGLRIESNEL